MTVIKWKHFPRYWPFVRGIHRSPVNSLHKGKWCGAFMFSSISAWIIAWVNNREAGDLRRHRDHNDVTVMRTISSLLLPFFHDHQWHWLYELDKSCSSMITFTSRSHVKCKWNHWYITILIFLVLYIYAVISPCLCVYLCIIACFCLWLSFCQSFCVTLSLTLSLNMLS